MVGKAIRIYVKTRHNGYVVVTGSAYVLVLGPYKAKLRHRLDPTIIIIITRSLIFLHLQFKAIERPDPRKRDLDHKQPETVSPV